MSARDFERVLAADSSCGRLSLGSDGSGVDLAPIVGIGRRCADCQRGSVSLFVLFMGLAMYAIVAMVWNTGAVAERKVETQTAADSAAYAAATWHSRAINVINATNQQILRDASTLTFLYTMSMWQRYAWLQIVGVRVQGALDVASGLTSLNPIVAAIGVVKLESADEQEDTLKSIMAETGTPTAMLSQAVMIKSHLQQLYEYQRAWVDKVPGLIEQQTALLEDYYDCDITVSSAAGPGSVGPPLQEGNPLTSLFPLLLRYAYDGMVTGSWYSDDRVQGVWKFKDIFLDPDIGDFIDGDFNDLLGELGVFW
ncbi:MAG: pilus assembly protein TadG-related protein, partial [Planctomycetota bacterium]